MAGKFTVRAFIAWIVLPLLLEAAAEGRKSNDGDCFDPVEVNVGRLCTLWQRRH
jgi:hypothetical protein